jgi:hypothetical protein
MNEIAGRVLDYLDYKNKLKTAEWEERLWRQHLDGAPQDFRVDADRQRYVDLLDRVEKTRILARRLHTRRTAHTPRFASFAAASA